MKAFVSLGRAARVPFFLLASWLSGSAFAQFETDPITVAEFNLPAQDAQGWTILTPAADSRLIYVDPVNGNDSTGTYYAPGATAVGANPQAPVGAVLAVRTLARAHALAREDQPDWILLKAGGVWTDQSLETRRGRSATARAVVCAYGVGPRPELRTGTRKAIADDYLTNIIIQGIRFWAHTRDRDQGPYFTGYQGSNGFNLITRVSSDARRVRDILIEDCVFRAYTNNVLTGSSGGGATPITRFVMRRSIVSGNYVGFSTDGHVQGLYHIGSGHPLQPSILLQENTFDHNGWRIQSREGDSAKEDGQATMFNHNTYFTAARGVIFQGNLFLRASSMGNKWTSQSENGSRAVVIENNFYVEGEIGIGMGGNNPLGPRRFQDIRIRDNVVSDIGRTRPSNRSLSWGIEAMDWNGGSLVNNLVVHQRSGIGNTFAFDITASSSTRDMLIAGNVVANLSAASGSPLVLLREGSKMQNVRFENNVVQSPTATPLASFTSGGYSFGGYNRYHSAASSGSRFRVNGSSRDLAGWISATGDAGAVFENPAFPDPARDVESYAAHLGLPGTLQGFIDAVYGQSKANWNPALTAPALNAWMRAGFGMAAGGPVAGTPLEGWRLAHFEGIENEGDAADLADPDGDGLVNLLEYATGTDPGASNPSPAVVGTATGGEFLTLSFAHGADPAITYTVLAGDDPGAFVPVAAYTGGAAGVFTHVDTVSLAAPGVRRFLRLRTSYGEEFVSWASRDVGSVGQVGSTRHGFGAGQTTIRAAGADIQGTSDAFRFVSLGDIQDDGELRVRVVSLTNTHSWAKAGVMIRAGLEAGAANVSVLVSPNGSVSLQHRATTGGSTVATTASGFAAPRWLRLVRTGNSFAGYHSANGSAWTQIGGNVAVTLPTTTRMGLAVTSHNASTLTTAVFEGAAATP